MMRKGKKAILLGKYTISIIVRKTFRRYLKFQNGHILVLVDGGLGDVILDAQLYFAMAEHCVSKKKELTFVADSSIISILKLFPELSASHFMVCPFLKGNMTGAKAASALHEIVATLKETEYEQVIIKVNRCNILPARIAVAISARKIITLCYNVRPHGIAKKVLYCVMRYASDCFLDVSDELTQMQRSKEFAIKLGLPGYSIQIPYLPKTCVSNKRNKPYITVAIDSSLPARRWPSDRFIELIHRLLPIFEYDVVLTGGQVDESTQKLYDSAFQKDSRVSSVVGKTTINEWVELIRGAAFHIGVDSGSIHIAAAVGTTAYCLTGVWDGHRFFPYQIEKKGEMTKEPILIYRSDVSIDSLLCKKCNAYGHMGDGNRECRRGCKVGKSNLCLHRISVDDVLEHIEQNMKIAK